MDQSVFESFLHVLQVWPIPLMRSLCFMGKGTPGGLLSIAQAVQVMGLGLWRIQQLRSCAMS